VQHDVVTMSSSPDSFKTANTGLENGSVNQKLVAICGIGVCDAEKSRGAQALWKNIVNSELITTNERKTNSDSAKLVDDETITNGSARKLNGPIQQDSIEGVLSEVAYEALQDGAGMNYRGQEALVGCFVTAFENDPSRESTSLFFTEPKDESTAASRLAQRYGLQGPMYDHHPIILVAT
jgi:acyl transferase domain-containing protein